MKMLIFMNFFFSFEMSFDPCDTISSLKNILGVKIKYLVLNTIGLDQMKCFFSRNSR